jgi:hypothetical protein
MQAIPGLKSALKEEREAAFFRLRGGYPIPLAGGIWWTVLGAAGYVIHRRELWILFAFVTSGTIFPLALLLAKLTKIDFMRDRNALSDMVVPALISMLLVWPMAISAFWTYPALVPLILSIGMSVQWPVIGWTYGRTALFTSHAIVRAVACFVLWNWLPSTRFTLLPLTVAAIYAATVMILYVTSSQRTAMPIQSLDSDVVD